MDTFGFDPGYAKSVTEREFVAHFSDKYPFNTVDLKAKYYELTGKTQEEKSTKSEEKSK